MNLRGIANVATQTVNPNIIVSVTRSAGFTVGPGAKQIPVYSAPIVGPAQLQALDGDDLKQLDGLNIQGSIRAIYLYGTVAGVLRPNQTGGDLITIGAETWLVVKVLETWPDWCKAAIVLQGQ